MGYFLGEVDTFPAVVLALTTKYFEGNDKFPTVAVVTQLGILNRYIFKDGCYRIIQVFLASGFPTVIVATQPGPF